jgi:hypothetical protein
MPRLYLLQWLKSDRALMMLFNDGTFQVNTLIIIIIITAKLDITQPRKYMTPCSYGKPAEQLK